MNVVLAGNPNAGKTTLFNFLTRSRLKTGNFHGVTTSSFSKKVNGVTFTDSPGLYAFEAYTMEENDARDSIRSADAIVNVVDSLTLKNSLALTKKLISLNKNTVVYLTKTRALAARGGWVKVGELEKLLGVPVYDCSLSQFKKIVFSGGLLRPVSCGETSTDAAYYGGNISIKRFEKPFYNKFSAPVIFAAAMVFTFFITFYPAMPGALLKGLIQAGFTSLGAFLSARMQNAVFASFFCDGLLGGVGGVISFAPQLALLWLSLILLDESGAMSALCFVTDGLFERVKLSGRAAFSLISGLGCTAAAITTTRGFARPASRSRTIAILPYIPCGAKLPVFLTFLSPVFADPFPAVCALYFCGLALALAMSLVGKGDEEGMISEIAPISLPSFRAVKNKLFFQLSSFIIKVTTIVAAFCMAGWLLSHLSPGLTFCTVEESLLCYLCRMLGPVFAPMGVNDWRVSYAFVTGFAAKENIAATLAMLGVGPALPMPSAVACCAFVLACPACVSAYAASCREIGWRRTLAYNLVQLAFALLFAYTVYFIMSLL